MGDGLAGDLHGEALPGLPLRRILGLAEAAAAHGAGGVDPVVIAVEKGLDGLVALLAVAAHGVHVGGEGAGGDDPLALVQPWEGLVVVEGADLAVEGADGFHGLLGPEAGEPAAGIRRGLLVEQDFAGDRLVGPGAGDAGQGEGNEE